MYVSYVHLYSLQSPAPPDSNPNPNPNPNPFSLLSLFRQYTPQAFNPTQDQSPSLQSFSPSSPSSLPRRVIILEEDLEIAPDFFEYFAALSPMLDSDPSLLGTVPTTPHPPTYMLCRSVSCYACCTVVYCTVLYCTVLCCAVLCCAVLCCDVM